MVEFYFADIDELKKITADLKKDVLKKFAVYKESEDDFYKTMREWLYYADFLQEEEPEIIDKICDSIRNDINDQEREFSDITRHIAKTARKFVYESRKKNGKAFKPKLLNDIKFKKRVPAEDSSGKDKTVLELYKKLPPFYRGLYGMYYRLHMKKKDIACLYKVTPACVSQWFKKIEKELQKLNKIEKPYRDAK